MLLDKRALVTTYQEKYQDDRGQAKVANRIPYDGYGVVPHESQSTPF